MLTIICGENTDASRDYYLNVKKQFKDKGYEIRIIKGDEVGSINQWLADSPSLFSQKRVFFSERLNKFIKRENKKLLEDLKKIEEAKEIELIDWEEVSLWELKLKKLGSVKEFKPDESIFKLQEALFPGNKLSFLKQLDNLNQSTDENFIFVMLVRYIRNLIIIKQGGIPSGIQTWQSYKLKAQAAKWKIENLVNFYQAFFKIEIGLKTSSNPFTLKESLDILACHFL